VLLRRATSEIEPSARRWQYMPASVSEIAQILRSMQSRNDLTTIFNDPRVYQVTVAYARQYQPDVLEVVMEVNPYAIVSHASALEFHGLSGDFRQRLILMTPSEIDCGLLPTGTESSDWEDLRPPPGYTAKSVLGQDVDWQRADPGTYFGFRTYQPFGAPVRVTTPERTLVEGLRNPQLCGGVETVLTAWERARWTLNVDAVIATVDRFNTGILRQRVGFVMESLGLTHAALEDWARHAQRGGSSKLVGSEPYVPTYSERWKLSLNAPVDVMQAIHV